MPKAQSAGRLEQLGTTIFGLRQWLFKSWQIAVLLGKGAYLLGERRRLLERLGNEVYERIQKGELENEELKPLVNQLHRLTKKVQIEEVLIRKIRFGKKSKQSSRSNSTQAKKKGNVAK